MKRIRASTMLLVIALTLVMPFMSTEKVSAYSENNGLLALNQIGNIGSNLDNINTTSIKATDRNESTYAVLSQSQSSNDALWFDLGTTSKITAYKFKGDALVTLRIYNSAKTLITNQPLTGDGLIRSFISNADIRYIVLENTDTSNNKLVQEFQLYGPIDYSGGLLDGKLSSTGSDLINYYSTDNNESTDNNLSSQGMRLKYELDTSRNITGYRLKTYDANEPNILFKNTSGTIITSLTSGAGVDNTGALISINVSGVKTIEVVNPNTSYPVRVQEINVYGDPPDTTPPPAPTGVTATPTNGSVSLSWGAVTGAADLAGYNVYLNGTKTNGAIITGTSFTQAASNNINNAWQVTAVDTSGNESVKSSTVTTHFDTISPVAPIGLVSTPQAAGTTKLTWQANEETDLAGYHVLQDDVRINPAIVTTNEYTVTGLLPNQLYSFAVTASDTTGNESPPSSSVTYFLDSTAPAKPTGLTPTTGINEVDLNWTANSTDADIASYNIYKGSALIGTVNHPTSTYKVTGLSGGTVYNFYVSAVDTSGNESEKASTSAAAKDPPAAGTGINYSEADWGFSATEIFTNSMWLVKSIGLFLLLALSTWYVPILIRVIRNSAIHKKLTGKSFSDYGFKNGWIAEFKATDAHYRDRVARRRGRY